MKRILVAAAALWGVVPSLEATSVVPVHDLGALARLSQSVVMAQVLESHSLRGRSGIETRTKCLLEAPLGPDAPQRVFYLAVPGGALPEKGLGMAVRGMPIFVPGRSYLFSRAMPMQAPFFSKARCSPQKTAPRKRLLRGTQPFDSGGYSAPGKTGYRHNPKKSLGRPSNEYVGSDYLRALRR